MRILFYGLNYWPEPTGAGRLTGMMAEWLSAQGHDVRVIAAPPYYPQWRVNAPYRSWRYRQETRSGVRICRCPLWVPRRQGGAARLAHLASFALSSAPVALAMVRWRPQVLLAVAPTLMTAPVALAAGALARAHTWLHVQDFEVDAAFDLRLMSGGWRRRAAAAVEARLLQRFATVSSMSRPMVDKLLAKGVAPARAFELRMWAEVQTIFPDPAAGQAMQQLLGVPAEATVALYTGNLAEKQGVDILAEVAAILQSRRDIVLLVCGAGSAQAKLQAASSGLPNLRIHGLQPPDRLNGLFNCADVHLLPQRAEAADLVFPSKLLSMLASGRSVAATARPDTEVGRLVEACGGWRTPPGDAHALAAAIVHLADHPALRAEAGARARQYVVEHLSAERVLGGFAAALEAAIAGAPRPQAQSAAAAGGDSLHN